MKNVFTFLAVTLLSLQFAVAQSDKKVIVEHFTNTNCSICGNRNPGFFKNLENFPDIIHLSFHPSSPYPSCLLSQQANPDNDARTNYYGIYGGTPRLVIQGEVISASANYSSPDLFSPYLGKTAPVDIKIDQYKYGIDSIKAVVTITANQNNQIGKANLFTALAEDTVFYKGTNKETMHFNVFRAAMSGIQGTEVTVPSSAGQSLVYTVSAPGKSIWNMSRIFTIAVLQNSGSKAIIQAQASLPADDKTTSTNSVAGISDVQIYPNPADRNFTIRCESCERAEMSLYSPDGKIISTNTFNRQLEVDVNGLTPGVYLVKLKNAASTVVKKLVVE